MRRRDLLRLLAVAGLAGCTTGIEPDDVAARSPSDPGQRPTAAPRPTPTASRSSVPAPRGDPPPRPTAEGPDPADARSTPEDPDAADPASGQDAPDEQPDPVEQPDRDAQVEADQQDDSSDVRDVAPAVVTAISRGALGLPPPTGAGRSHHITGLAVHHTAAPTVAASEAPGRFRAIVRDHQARGWIDVAYHWGVDVDGNVYELRDERVAGDTGTDYDPAGWFLVVCEGDFEQSEPPQAMLDALAAVLADGARRHAVAPDRIRGHRDLAATLCPGARLQARIGELQEAVAAQLAAGVMLEVTDDPDLVARIEDGSAPA